MTEVPQKIPDHCDRTVLTLAESPVYRALHLRLRISPKFVDTAMGSRYIGKALRNGSDCDGSEARNLDS